nr:RNA-dependent RNA polymerase [Pea streak virus]
MALTYRSPLEEVLGSFSSSEQSLIAIPAIANLKGVEQDNHNLFNYALSPIAKQKLISNGLYLSPFSAMPHSHPVCKTLENYLLYKVLPNYIDHRFYFVGIKESKINFLRSREKKLNLCEVVNRYVTSADKARYGSEFTIRRTLESDNEIKSRYGRLPPNLVDLIPQFSSKQGLHLFLHDELHYWSRADLRLFLTACNPIKMLATVVIPPELLIGATESMNKWCYTFNIEDGELFFFPDGVTTEGYSQRADCADLLNLAKIILDDGTTYCVDILCSKFSHHLIAITRGDAIVPKTRTFSNFEAVGTKGIADLMEGDIQCLPISYTTISKIERYLMTLNKPDVQSAIAKLGQIVQEPSAFEIKFVREYAALHISKRGLNSLILRDNWARIKAEFLKLLPKALYGKFDTILKVALEDFESNLAPLTFRVKLQEYGSESLTNRLDSFIYRTGGIAAVVNGLIELFGPINKSDRKSSPYSDFYCAELFVVNSGTLRRSIIDMLKRSYSYNALMELNPYGFYTLLVERAEGNLVARYVLSGLQAEDIDAYIMRALSELQEEEEEQILDRKMLTYLDLAVKEEEEQAEEIEEEVEEIKTTKAFDREVSHLNCDCGMSFECGKTILVDQARVNFLDDLGNRSATFFSKCQVEYKYNGGAHEAIEWPAWMDMLLECNGFDPEEYDCVLVQIYSGGSKIGFHADDEVIFPRDGKILTMTTGGSANFSVRCSRGGFTFNFGADTYLIMPEGCQNGHKHAVSNCTHGRISYTFRQLKQCREYLERECEVESSCDQSESEQSVEIITLHDVEIKQGKDVDTQFLDVIEVPGDGNCFWHSLGYYFGLEGKALKEISAARLEEMDWNLEALKVQMSGYEYCEFESIVAAARLHSVQIEIIDLNSSVVWVFTPRNDLRQCVRMQLLGEHYSPVIPKEVCVLRAIAESLGKTLQDIHRCLTKAENRNLLDLVESGEGLEVFLIEPFMTLFGIRAVIDNEGDVIILNPKGALERFFQNYGSHLVHVDKNKIIGLERFGEVEGLGVERNSLAALKAAGTELVYEAKKDRADILCESLHSGLTGVISSKLYNDQPLIQNPGPGSVSRNVTVILGTFGAGKSTLFIKFLKANEGKRVHFVSPRKVLAEEIRMNMAKALGYESGRMGKSGKLKSKNWFVHTFEVFLLKIQSLKGEDCVVMDEIQLFPPGYLDCVTYQLSGKCELVALGDPAQSDYDNEKDRNILCYLGSDLERALQGVDYDYTIGSYRFQNRNFLRRLPCAFMQQSLEIDEPYLIYEGVSEFLKIAPEYRAVVLVAGFTEKKLVRAYYGQDCKVLTFGESTGLTFDRGLIILSADSLKVNEKRWVTALSRFRQNLAILNLTGDTLENLVLRKSNSVLADFLRGSSSTDKLKEILPGNPKFKQTFIGKIGKDQGLVEEKLVGDPWLKGELFLGQTEDAEVALINEFMEQDQWFKTHLPRCEMEGVRSRWLHLLLEKDAREYRFRDMVTEQFTDDHDRGCGERLTNAAERFEAIYPRHRASDNLTFLMAVKKRLRFSKPHIEEAKLNEALPYGKFLLDEFLKKIPLRASHRPDLMAEAVQDFEEKKRSKSAATIENHAGRSCRDWLADVGLVFSKSQICTKFDNRFRCAKAAQSIVCFQHSVLCRFAPYMRYIEKLLGEALQKTNYYIHSGKRLEELDDWVIRGNFTGVCTESDYEAFDASQDHWIMAFELTLMEHLGLPRDLIADYRYIKTHLGSKLGSFAIMRFSGEASTFLFNTMANALFTFLRYDTRGDEFICFAGDDMCASKHLKVSDKFEDFLSKLKLKAKVQFTKNPTFCGWSLLPFGIFKKPQLVYERICIAREKKNLHNCIDNYAIELSYAYKRGEQAVNAMNEEETDAFYNCVRVIIKRSHLLRSDVKTVFLNAKSLMESLH